MSPGLRSLLGLGKDDGRKERRDADDSGGSAEGRREAMRDRARQLV